MLLFPLRHRVAVTETEEVVVRIGEVLENDEVVSFA